MNLRKMVTAASMAFAVIAFANPVLASANPVFTHEGTPIQGPTVSFAGPTAFVLENGNGIHCSEVTVSLVLNAGSTGTIESYTTYLAGETQCTTTPDNFVVHTEPTGLPWAVDTTTVEGKASDVLTITNVDINTNITHPLTECVIAVRRFTGTVDATIAAGQTGNISTVTLSGTGVQVHGALFPSAVVSGTLHKEGNTVVGIQ